MKPADLRPEDFVGAKSHPLTWSRREEIRKDVILQVLSALRFLLQRQEGDKPFLDTKFQVGSGKDFDRDDPLRGGHVIYTWIQGRGLEALADHARWLEKEEAIGEELRESLISAIRVVLPRVIGSMEAALALPTAPADEKQELVEIFLRSWEAFAGRFVRKEYHLLPVPCLDQWGNESKAIPAVPDGDPGYHTGLSLLACLPALN